MIARMPERAIISQVVVNATIIERGKTARNRNARRFMNFVCIATMIGV